MATSSPSVVNHSETSPTLSSPPVAFIIFKRPDTTQAVFNAIRQVQPKTLLVIADGPRPDRDGEVEKCAQTRAIIDQVDWDCEVLKCYSDVNLGLGTRIATGLSWVFEHVEEAIILEDDCLPDPSFFQFCQDMLDRYREESRIMSVSGCLFAKSPTANSYYFSHYLSCWGWATWKRAWEQFDFGMPGWQERRAKDWLTDYLGDRAIADLWTQRFDSICDPNRNDIWSYQFQYACWLHNAMSIRSNVNLITNVGIGADGTHTKQVMSDMPFNTLDAMAFPLNHPTAMKRDLEGDRLQEKYLLSRANPSLITRITRKLTALLPG